MLKVDQERSVQSHFQEELAVTCRGSEKVHMVVKRKPFTWSMVVSRYNYTVSLVQPGSKSSLEEGQDNDSIDPMSIRNREAPTAHFLKSQGSNAAARHYLDQYLRVLPMESILQREMEHLDTHVPIYSAVSKPVFLIQTFTSKLIALAEMDLPRSTARSPEQITWLRNPFAKVPAMITPDAPSYVYLRGKSILDNTETTAWNLISCNPHLFGNTLINSMESTVDYWWDNTNVAPPSLEKIVNESLNTLHILEGTENSGNRQKFLIDLGRTLEMIEGERGVIFQMFVPHAEVNQTVYISEANGIPNENHPNALEALIGIQHLPAEAITNYDSMQLRLMAGRWMNPSIAADYRTFTYSDVSAARMAEFESVVGDLVHQAVVEST